MYDVFLICPVRGATPDQKLDMERHISKLEEQGKKVYYPARDTDQVDDMGLRICNDNMSAMDQSSEVHIYWDPNSSGSLFDLGMAFAMNKPIHICNIDELEKTETKSFTNMLLRLCNWE